MKESLVAQFDRHPPGVGPDGERLDTPFYTVNYDFRLRPEARRRSLDSWLGHTFSARRAISRSMMVRNIPYNPAFL